MLTHGFFGYIVAFGAILFASFVFLFGLSYWNSQGVAGETTCVTSSGDTC